MANIEQHIYRWLHKYRRAVQLLALAFIFAVPLLNGRDWNHIIGTYYSISIGGLDIVDPALVIQFLLLTKSITLSLFIAGLIPLIAAFFLGKVFCSWVCPYNLFAEWGEKLRGKIGRAPTRRRNRNPKRYIYWLVYAVILLIIPILSFALINFISLPGLISSAAADVIISATIGVEILLVVVILSLEFAFYSRFWCKYICPVGATLELPRNRHTLQIHFNHQRRCVCDGHEPACNIICPLHLDPRRPDIHPYCYNCGECIRACQAVGGENLSFSIEAQKKRIQKHSDHVNTEV